jgi:hypothetical protein
MAARSGRARARKTPGGAGWTQLPLGGAPSAPAEAPPSRGEWLEVLVADLAIEVGDVANIPAHRDRVKELWRRSGLAEIDFARSWRGTIGRAGSEAEPELKMKAFFLLLKDRVGVVEGSDAALSSVNRFKRIRSGPVVPRRIGAVGERSPDAP